MSEEEQFDEDEELDLSTLPDDELVQQMHDDLYDGLIIFIKKALPLTIVTAIFGIVGLYLLNITYDLDNAILKIIFIGLASLTFPHILLEYLLEENER